MENLNETIRGLVISAFAVDSIGSVILRGVIWLAVAIIIIASVDVASHRKGGQSTLKSNLGFFLMFLIVTGVLVYMLFGFSAGGAQASN